MSTEFYKNAEILITGGSGVLGKAAIENLLRKCDVSKIYVLIRTRKNVSPEDRLGELKKSRIFRLLKEQKPNELDEKLVAIPGDITHNCMGITESYKSMMKNVTIVIHMAASTNFNLPLRTAIEANLKSTEEALRFAEQLEKLQIFLYASTFYCNPFVEHLEPKVYPAVFDYKMALKLLEPEYEQQELLISAIENKVITEFPNTYVFTKHLAEQIVNDYRHKLPVAIYRPAIVTSAFREPEPGFTETMTGVMGLLAVWGTGLLQVVLSNPKLILDFIPLDISTMYMLVFLEKAARLNREKNLEKIPVSMATSSRYLRFNFKEIGNVVTSAYKKNPLEKSLWIPNVTVTSCPFIFWIYTMFLQVLPAFIFDILLRLFRQKPFMMKVQRKIYYTSQALLFFLVKPFSSDGSTDNEEFFETTKGTQFDERYITESCSNLDSFKSMLETQMLGCRKFLFNEDESTLPRSRIIMKVKIIVYNIIRLIVLFYVGKYVYQRLWN